MEVHAPQIPNRMARSGWEFVGALRSGALSYVFIKIRGALKTQLRSIDRIKLALSSVLTSAKSSVQEATVRSPACALAGTGKVGSSAWLQPNTTVATTIRSQLLSASRFSVSSTVKIIGTRFLWDCARHVLRKMLDDLQLSPLGSVAQNCQYD